MFPIFFYFRQVSTCLKLKVTIPCTVIVAILLPGLISPPYVDIYSFWYICFCWRLVSSFHPIIAQHLWNLIYCEVAIDISIVFGNLLNFRAESGTKRFGRNCHCHSYSGLVSYAAFRGVPNSRQTAENSLFRWQDFHFVVRLWKVQ